MKNQLHLSNNQLSKITLYRGKEVENDLLCFLKFHNYEMMLDFIDYHRKNERDLSGYKSSGYRSAKNEKTDEDTQSKKKSVKDKPQSQSDKPQAVAPKKVGEPVKKQGYKVVGFKIDSEGEKFDETKVSILETHEIIRHLQILESEDAKHLKVPLELIKKEMKISVQHSLAEVKKAIEEAY
mmetsp:Transcript_13543/g.21108  ORF Transcript_13543/g.21108 Transcript_13543/m.21108 type:complete len:181 (-) Transcript_13543:16646-17188(-)